MVEATSVYIVRGKLLYNHDISIQIDPVHESKRVKASGSPSRHRPYCAAT